MQQYYTNGLLLVGAEKDDSSRNWIISNLYN